MKRLIFAAAIVLFTGCPSGQIINDDYVKADHATFIAVAGEYLTYVENNWALSKEEKSRRWRTITTWRLRLEQAEKPVSVAPETSGN